MTTLKSYKVEIEEITTYIFDVQAENEQEAREKTANLWEEACNNGTYHYHETGDTTHDITEVFNVTGTDDDAFLTTNN